ncbi:Peroxisome biogenesis protein [Actinidia chinensis var. chinensis]|uniref:Peroxisomal membrane protein PEX16 n=1 Tax=Actinidia chinensis var. chinensis TaxID=1590841 RepID=A0A2R6R9V5_ACTCC|nr:Peroxisome biogenesis protein [Actinidia chinensis var. chinensis]
MEAYKIWVRRNKDYVHSLESLASGLTWLLPERFSESEIGPEAVTAVLGMFTAVNDHIIDTIPTQVKTGSAEPSSFPYSLCITLLKDLETLVEVTAQHFYGDDKKWNFIAATEAMKALVRLALFRNSGYKMLLHGGETPNVEKGSGALNSQNGFGHLAKPGWQPGPGNLKNYHEKNSWNLEGRAMSALSRFGENARMASEPTWLHRVQHQHALMEPPLSVAERPTLSTIFAERGLRGALFMLGEVMFITRPLIYVLLIRKYGIRSWFPWCISLAVDLAGVGILSHVMMLRQSTEGRQLHLSELEKNELRRRKLLWALYLMRDPFFDKYTRKKLQSAERLLEPVPVIGILTSKIMELITGAQTRYTYMSGS